MDYLVLLSYLSLQLFFKIEPFAGLSYVLLKYIELSSYPKFLLIHRYIAYIDEESPLMSYQRKPTFNFLLVILT